MQKLIEFFAFENLPEPHTLPFQIPKRTNRSVHEDEDFFFIKTDFRIGDRFFSCDDHTLISEADTFYIRKKLTSKIFLEYFSDAAIRDRSFDISIFVIVVAVTFVFSDIDLLHIIFYGYESLLVRHFVLGVCRGGFPLESGVLRDPSEGVVRSRTDDARGYHGSR